MRAWWIVAIAVVGCQRGDHGLDTERFVSAWAKMMPGEMCKPQVFFRACFTVDEAGCLAQAKASVADCVRDQRASWPATIDSKETGRRVGTELGFCAGAAYERALAARGQRLANPKCNDPSAWVPN